MRRAARPDWLQDQEIADFIIDRELYLEDQKQQMEALMGWIDGLEQPMRELVHEFGANIVIAMVNDGYHEARELRGILEERHRRRQLELLNANYNFRFANKRRGP